MSIDDEGPSTKFPGDALKKSSATATLLAEASPLATPESSPAVSPSPSAIFLAAAEIDGKKKPQRFHTTAMQSKRHAGAAYSPLKPDGQSLDETPQADGSCQPKSKKALATGHKTPMHVVMQKIMWSSQKNVA